MFGNMISRMWPRKKPRTRNTATIAGLSLAAASGALIAWYTSRKIRDRRENEILFSDESQP